METKTWQVKLTLLLVSSLTIMSVITISPALPQMTIVFAGVKNAAFIVKMVLTIPALMIAIVSPVTGRLIDRRGRLKILRFALVLYAVSGVGGYFLNNLYYILISRAILGISVGMSMTIVITLIADYFEGMQRQKFVGLQIAFMSIGGILFLVLGGILADIGWRYPFLIYLSSLLVLPLTIIFLREPAVVQKRNEAHQYLKAPPIIWLLFFNIMVMWIIFFLIPVQIPFYLKSIGVEKNSLIGAAIAISTLFSAMSSFSYSRIKARLSFLSIFSIGYLLMAAGFICIAFSTTYVIGCCCNDVMRAGNGHDDTKYKYVGNENCAAGNSRKRNWKAYHVLVFRTIFISRYYSTSFKKPVFIFNIYDGRRFSFSAVAWFPAFSFQ